MSDQNYPGCASLSNLITSGIVLTIVIIIFNYGDIILEKIPFISKEYTKAYNREILGDIYLINMSDATQERTLLFLSSSRQKNIFKDLTKKIPNYTQKTPKKTVTNPIIVGLKPLEEYAPLWEFVLEEVPSTERSQVQVLENTTHLFFLWKKQLWALQKDDGKLTWKRNFSENIRLITLKNDDFIVITEKNLLESYALETGKKNWQLALNATFVKINQLEVLEKKLIIIGLNLQKKPLAVAVELRKQPVLKYITQKNENNLALWLEKEQLYILTQENTQYQALQSWNVDSGKLLWKKSLPSNFKTNLKTQNSIFKPFIQNNKCYLTGDVLGAASLLIEIHTKSGKIRTIVKELEITFQAAYLNDEMVILYAQKQAKDAKPEIWGVLREDGEVVWKQPSTHSQASSWLIEGNNAMIFFVEILPNPDRVIFTATNIDAGNITLGTNTNLNGNQLQGFFKENDKLYFNVGEICVLDLQTGKVSTNYP